ncbi:MAG: hypothetical protein COA84_07680 [Robiginitomaculum sp.]|nr:MAG: hypothetical protein COA84_07680 [Robiginitomaculum sp.]
MAAIPPHAIRADLSICIDAVAPLFEPGNLIVRDHMLKGAFGFHGQTPSACNAAVLLRSLSAYLAHAAFGISATQISHDLNMSRSAVSRAINKVEDLRDNQDLDAFLDAATLYVKARSQICGGNKALPITPYKRPRADRGVAA